MCSMSLRMNWEFLGEFLVEQIYAMRNTFLMWLFLGEANTLNNLKK